jgi:hypothetical protein
MLTKVLCFDDTGTVQDKNIYSNIFLFTLMWIRVRIDFGRLDPDLDGQKRY